MTGDLNTVATSKASLLECDPIVTVDELEVYDG